MTTVQLHTGPGVFEVLVNVCRNPQEALKQFVDRNPTSKAPGLFRGPVFVPRFGSACGIRTRDLRLERAVSWASRRTRHADSCG